MNSGALTTAVTIFLFVVGALLSLCGFLVVLQLNDIRRQLQNNTRNLVRLARAGWGLAIRQTDVEEHLAESDDYKPIRIKDADPPVL